MTIILFIWRGDVITMETLTVAEVLVSEVEFVSSV